MRQSVTAAFSASFHYLRMTAFMKCSHAFNLLDSRGALSAVERANYILRVRTVAKACCESYLEEVASKKAPAATTQEEVA